MNIDITLKQCDVSALPGTNLFLSHRFHDEIVKRKGLNFECLTYPKIDFLGGNGSGLRRGRFIIIHYVPWVT